MGRGGCHPIALAALCVALAGACAADDPMPAAPAASPGTTAERQLGPASTGVPSTPTTATTAPGPAMPAGDDTTVESVTDGDTIRVAGGARVRLIGIDTPETVDPRREVQCFGPEASARMRALLPHGTAVRLVYDVERTDRYGRTLAYLYRSSDGEFVNAAMVRDGFASAYTVPPNVAHADEFVALQREAREHARGLWGACPTEEAAPQPRPQPQPLVGQGGPSVPSGASSCDVSYPDVCIPPAPPDLDCGEIPHRRFRVLPPDPHGFDGNDDDGVGCESG